MGIVVAILSGLLGIAVLVVTQLLRRDRRELKAQAESARRAQAEAASGAVKEQARLETELGAIDAKARTRTLTAGELADLHARTRTPWPPRKP